MKLRKVLILHKKSTFQIQAIEHREARFIQLLEEKSEVVTRVKLAHAEHVQTLHHLESELRKRNIEFQSIARAELKDRVTDIDMMIAVGGDGTFLDASHSLEDIPLLGVNSSSSSSFGHFCLAGQDNLSQILDDIESDSLKPSSLLRLELKLNGSTLPELVLNEVLVSHSNPAATSRYFIGLNEDDEEEQAQLGIMGRNRCWLDWFAAFRWRPGHENCRLSISVSGARTMHTSKTIFQTSRRYFEPRPGFGSEVTNAHWPHLHRWSAHRLSI